MPKSNWKPPSKVPKEESNKGTNLKVYYVCHNPGIEWVRLPAIVPEQISISRKIKCLFTGNLENKILSCPPFPGNESNYLRAQIARISACTHISPEGYFQYGDGEEEEDIPEEDEGERIKCSKNLDYEALPINELANKNLMNWVHHCAYILPQGRCTWWDPNKKADDELDELEEESDENQSLQALPEHGPPILSRIAEDIAVFGKPAWTIRQTNDPISEYSCVTLCSTIWPGAATVAWKKSFENVYIGWGVKAAGCGFDPHIAKTGMREFVDNASILNEAVDPTPEEEAALRAAKMGPMDENEMDEEGDENLEDEDDE